jgi:hypothetical protein
MITLRRDHKGVIIDGTCSCLVRSNCKHVAAVLIEVERRLPSSAGPGQGRSPQLWVWLEELDRAYADSFATNTYPPEIRQRLIYVLGVDSDRNGSPGPSRKPPNPHFEVRRINSANAPRISQSTVRS